MSFFIEKKVAELRSKGERDLGRCEKRAKAILMSSAGLVATFFGVNGHLRNSVSSFLKKRRSFTFSPSFYVSTVSRVLPEYSAHRWHR